MSIKQYAKIVIILNIMLALEYFISNYLNYKLFYFYNPRKITHFLQECPSPKLTTKNQIYNDQSKQKNLEKRLLANPYIFDFL